MRKEEIALYFSDRTTFAFKYHLSGDWTSGIFMTCPSISLNTWI